jgi:hypothetical protein
MHARTHTRARAHTHTHTHTLPWLQFFFNAAITAVAARIILKEPLSWLATAGVVLSLAGVVLVAHPPSLFGTEEVSKAHR